YAEQPTWLTVPDFLWARFRRELGMNAQPTPVLAVIATETCGGGGLAGEEVGEAGNQKKTCATVFFGCRGKIKRRCRVGLLEARGGTGRVPKAGGERGGFDSNRLRSTLRASY